MIASQSPLDVRLRSFLLGTLSDADRDELEERLLADDNLYVLLVAAEEELLDDCIRGALDEAQARSFLGYLEKLPDGRERIDFARDLRACLSRGATVVEAPHPRAEETALADRLRNRAGWLLLHRTAWSAVALVLAVSFGFLAGAWVSSDRLKSETAESPRVPSATDSASLPPVLLTAGILRGGSSLPVVELSPSQLLLELELDVGLDEHESYQAVLHDVDARELFAVSQLKPAVTPGRIVVAFTIPTHRLPTGDYFVSLFGAVEPGGGELLGRYDFRILVR